MGFFERKLGSFGEAMDDGIDRARIQARDLCDRQGWSDRAETLRDRTGLMRERVRERAEVGRRELSERWGSLGREARRRVYAGAAVLGVLVLTGIVRAVVFHGPPMPSKAELALMESMRARSSKSQQWYSAGQSVDPMLLFRQDD